MSDHSLRYAGTAFGFALGIVWITSGIGAALLCLGVSALGYGGVLAVQRFDLGGAVTTALTLRARLQEKLTPPPRGARPVRKVRREEIQERSVPHVHETSYGW